MPVHATDVVSGHPVKRYRHSKMLDSRLSWIPCTDLGYLDPGRTPIPVLFVYAIDYMQLKYSVKENDSDHGNIYCPEHLVSGA